MSEQRPPSDPGVLGSTGVVEQPLAPPALPTAGEQPAAAPPWYKDLPDASNAFAARLIEKPELGQVSLFDRAALDAKAASYTGSATGSLSLKLLQDVASGARAYPYLTPEQAQAQLDSIKTDLARQATIPSYEGPFEGAAALAGTLAGGAASPESWITRFPGAAWAVGKVAGEAAETVAGRIMEAALSQGGIQVVTDPVAQAGSLMTGIQQDYDWSRTALAFPLGAIFGGTIQGGGELARTLFPPRLRPEAPPRPVEAPAYEAPPPEAAPAAPPSAPAAAAETLPRAPVPLQLPEYAREAFERTWATAQRLGVIDDVERLAAEQKTAADIVKELGPRLDSVREIARSNNESESNAAQQFVRDVRSGLGIPSLDQRTEFDAWKAAYDARVPAAGAAADQPQLLLRGREGDIWNYNVRGPDGRDLGVEIRVEIANGLGAIHDIVGPGAGYLGPRAMRALLAQFAAEHPEVEQITGLRTTGGRIAAGGAGATGIDLRRLREAAPARYTTEPDHEAPGQFVAKDGAGKVVAVGDSPEQAVRLAQQRAVEAAPGGEVRARAAPAQRAPLPPPAPPGAATTPGETLRSLHQQAFDLAAALDVPLRQGRMARPDFAGQYSVSQGVIRQQVVADFDTFAHEAGHALEHHVGPDLTALTNRFAAELAPLDYDPAQARVFEGFAEWMRHYLQAPAAAQREAPGFYAAFRDFMQRTQPELAAALDRAQTTYQAWLNADSAARIDAIVQRTEPDTLLRRLRRDGFAPTVSLMMHRVYTALLDQNAPVVQAIRSMAREAYRASGMRMDLQGVNDPEKLVRLFARAAQAADIELHEGIKPYHQIVSEGPSLRDAVITATGDPGIFGRWDDPRVKQFANYLIARRSEVLWRKYDAGELTNRPLAMTKADVAQAIQRLEAANPNFRAGAQQAHDYTRQLLRKMYEGGLIDRELYDRLAQEEFYVPMYRDLSEQPLAAGRPTAGAAGAGPGRAELIRRQGGSDRNVIDPLQSLMSQTYLVERTLAHNDIIKSLVGVAREARQMGATGTGRILEEIPAHQIVGKRFDLAEAVEAAGRQNGIHPDDIAVLQGALTDLFGDDPIMGTIFRREPTAPRGEPIVFYKDGGQLKAVRLISEKEGLGLYENLATLPPALRDIALKWLAVSSTALRIGVTTNPVFAVTNWARDQLAAAVLHPGYIPFNPMGIYREITGDKWSSLYAYAGGMNPGSAAIDMTARVNRDIEALARKGWAVQKVGGFADLFTRGDIVSGGKAIAEFVGTTETGTRLNVFKRVFEQKKRQGLGDYDAMIEAAAAASDLPDFSRHGSRTATIRSLVTFLNANLQGLDKARRTLFEPLYRAATGGLVTQQDMAALKTAGQAWGLIGGSAALGFAYGLWASGYEAYRDANHDTKSSHLVVPGDAFGRPGKTLLVPKPFELAIGFNLGEAAGMWLATGDPRAASQAMSGVLDVLTPPETLPPGISTAVELGLNRSFFTGREIVRPEQQRLPAAQQVTPQTSSLAKWLGGLIGVSPIKVDYAIGKSFGLWGRDIMAAASASDPNAPDVPPEDAMFLRRFLKDADRSSQTTQTFWQLAAQQNGEYAQAKNGYDNLVSQFHDKDAMEFLAGLPPEQRAYVTLQSAVNPDTERPAFSAEEKRLQPLTRAAEAVTVINGMVKELNENWQRQIDSGEQMNLNSTERREAIDGLRMIQAMEQRNALVILGAPGYADRKLLSTEDQFGVLSDQVPAVAAELAARYATARIAKTAAVAEAWPQAQRRLLAEGGAADLKDLAVDVRSEGPAFEGERVRGAHQHRRIEIPALPPEMAAQP